MGAFRSYTIESKPVFFAMQYNPITRSKQELINEENNDLAEINGTNKTQQTQNLEIQDSASIVMFDDHISGMRIQVALSHENIKRLQNRFHLEDFYQRNDNVIRLSGKAEAFVSGWFGDLAYRQNYLGADVNNNGKIDRDEFGNLRIGRLVRASVTPQGDYYESGIAGYVTLGNQWYDDKARNGETTLAGALNRTLQLDANLDGVCFHVEGQTQKEIEYEIDKAMNANGFTNTNRKELNPDEILMNGLKKLLEQQKLIEKLRQKNGDIGNLTAEERELLGHFIGNTVGLSNEEIDALQDKVQNQTLKDMAEVSGVEVENLHETIIKTLNALPNKNTIPIDNELTPVVDEIRSQIHNGAVATLDIKI